VANNNDSVKKAILLLIPIIFLVFTIYYPLLSLLYTIYSVNILGIVSSYILIYSIKISMLEAVLSAILSFLIGYPGGIILARYSFPGKKIIQPLLIIPFLMPSIVVAIGIIDVYSAGGFITRYVPLLQVFSSGLPAILYANVFFNAPLIMFFTYAELESFEQSQENAARTLGSSRFHLFRAIIWPNSKAAALAGTLIAFIYSFMGFTIPLILGGARYFTMEDQIYALYFDFLDLRTAVLLSIAELLILAVPSLLYIRWITRKKRRFYRAERERELIHLPRASAVEIILVSMYLIFIILFIVPVLFSPVLYSVLVPHTSILTLYYYQKLFSPIISFKLGVPMINVLLNTAFFALVVSLAVLIISLFVVYNLETIKKRAWVYDINLFLPLVISPIVLALAIYLAYRIYLNVGSVVWPLIILAQSVIAIPLTLRILTSSIAHVQPELRDSAILLGASRLSAFFKVELPLIKKGVITAFSFSFAISIGEFAATNFLYIPRYTTLAISIYNLLNLREYVLASAAASILILLSFIYFFIIQFYGEHTEYE